MTRFIRKKIDDTPIQDTVFAIVGKANQAKSEIGEDKVVDATIGSLYDESGNLVAFDSVFKHYNEMENRVKAKYASSFSGNPTFRKQVFNWLNLNNQIKLAHSVIATPGGSGAVSTTMVDVLDTNECVVLPEIAWGSYKLMASMYNLNSANYSLFENNHFNIKDFETKCNEVMDKQGKVLAIINDPCHNPTGYSLSYEEWHELIQVLNKLGEKGPVVLLNDIAYIDYSYDFNNSRKYMENFNDISNNVMIVVAFSTSKTMTSYGLRCGAALILAQDEKDVRQMEIVMEKSARATWSNIPNAAMDNFTYVTTEGLASYNEEKDQYVALLKKRSDIFTKEADEVGLIYYPYKEGFFVTLNVSEDIKNKYHEALMKENIYTVQVTKGIRVAMCSLNIEKCKGLAKKMKEILNTVE